MSGFTRLEDLELNGKTVLVRADLNVPMADGQVSDDTRIRAVIPTLKAILDKGGRVGVLSHFGRPKGQVVPEASLQPLVGPLADALGQPVAFAADCVGAVAQDALSAHAVVLLENVRFHPGEESNNSTFAAELALLGDFYVNDAFSAAHRAHASTEGIAHHMRAAAGLSMQAELEALEKALGAPEKPVAALVGGAKVSTKLAVLGSLIPKVDEIIIGGGMANTFLYAQGVEIGSSLCEKDLADTARDILAEAKRQNTRLRLPVDAMVAQELASGVPTRTCPLSKLDADDMILDIGPESIADLKAALPGYRTLVWNGPLGAFEIPPFDKGTVEIAKAAAALSTEGRLLTVAGGGDTVAALNHAGVAAQFSHVSTAGGAFLEWLEGKPLPGVQALT